MDKRHQAQILCSIFFLSTIGHSTAQTTVLASTPPMGWSTWNHFHHDISDAVVRAQADAMVSTGMRDAGYVYVNIDGGWEGYRDAAGVLHPIGGVEASTVV